MSHKMNKMFLMTMEKTSKTEEAFLRILYFYHPSNYHKEGKI